MDCERAPDVDVRLQDVIERGDLSHVITPRIICMRSTGARANAYARIWSLPRIWMKALDINPFYVIEVLSEHFDPLPEDEKTKVLIHELLHIPKRFTGGLRPHRYNGGRVDARAVNKVYEVYKKNCPQDL